MLRVGLQPLRFVKPSLRAPRVYQQLRASTSASTVHAVRPPSLSSRTVSRSLSTAQPTADAPAVGQRKTRWLWIDSLFPLRLVTFDLRYLIATFQREEILDRVRKILTSGPEAERYGFRLESIKAREKDGGAFAQFSYDPSLAAKRDAGKDGEDAVLPNEVPPESRTEPRDLAATDIEHIIDAHVKELQGGKFHLWGGLSPMRVFDVQGRPWLEDMRRFPNSLIRIEFEGGDPIPQEQLFEILRPYGRIHDIFPGAKSTDVQFASHRGATAARNCLHGAKFGPEGGKQVTMRILYRERMHANMFKEWVSSHPRVVFPIVLLLLGSLSFMIFDPIRTFSVRTKVEGTFDLRQFRLYRWLKSEALGRLGFGSRNDDHSAGTGIEKQRADAAQELKTWLKERPDTFIMLQGPRGSGKEALLQDVTRDRSNVLVIDCAEIIRNARSDDKLAQELATQVGYWPQFAWFAGLAGIIDLASVSLIGTKTGFATPLPDQLKGILNTTATALKRIVLEIRQQGARQLAESNSRREVEDLKQKYDQQVERTGVVRDGRLDAIAGNGAMSELGGGIERDHHEDLVIVGPKSARLVKAFAQEEGKPQDTAPVLPLVIIKSFDTREGAGRSVLWDSLSEFAATLVENSVAHVVFTSDNIVVPKSLTKALPSKPVSQIALLDASEENAEDYVFGKLERYTRRDVKVDRTDPEARTAVSKLGGRQADLEVLLGKVVSGQSVPEAVADIVARSAIEIRKNCFADGDVDEAKNLAWTQAQAYTLVKSLSDKPEIPYANVLMDTFKGSDAPLRALEQAELVTVSHREGRPSVIRPGKPVYRHAFSALIRDTPFRASQELAIVQSSILKAAEEELVKLTSLFSTSGKFTIGGTSSIPIGIARRAEVLLNTMAAKQEALDKLGAEADQLKAELKTAI